MNKKTIISTHLLLLVTTNTNCLVIISDKATIHPFIQMNHPTLTNLKQLDIVGDILI